MHVCPICGWPMPSLSQLSTHMEIKHKVQYLTVKPSGDQFEMETHRTLPEGDWIQIGWFCRTSDGQHFIAFGQDIYAGEVDENKLSADIAEFLGLGKRLQT